MILRALVRSLQRRWRIAAVAAVAALAISWIFFPSLLTFTAEARVILREGGWSAGRAAEFSRSTPVLEQAARVLADSPASIDPATLGREAARLQASLSVTPRPDAPALILAFKAATPSGARASVNAVGTAFQSASAAHRLDEIAAALKRIDEAIAERQRGLERILPPLQSRDFIRERLESLDRAIENDRAEVASLTARIEQIAGKIERNEPGPARPVDTAESDRLGGEIEGALRQRQALRETYPDDWPPIGRLTARIEEMRAHRSIAVNREILAARFAPLRSLIEEVRDLAARRDRLQESLPARYDEAERLRQRLRPAQPPGDEAEGHKTRAQQQALTDSIAELEAARTRRMVEKASGDAVVERVEPARSASLAGAALPFLLALALVAGVLAALIAEALTTTLRTEYDVRRYLNLPLMAIVPDTKEPSRRTLIHDGEPAAESFGTLAALVETRAKESAARLFAVTSAVPGEGKSTVACNLAISLARAGSRVLLVDADLRRGTQHNLFSVPNEGGLSSYLQGATDAIDSTLATVEIDNLTLLPSGPRMENPIPYLHSERFQALLQDLRGWYDYVVLDLPPVRNAADALVAAPLADGILLVIAASETRKDDASYLKRMLRSVNGKIWGCVLTKATIRSRGYYVYSPQTANS